MSTSYFVYRPRKSVNKSGRKKSVPTPFYWAQLPGPDGKSVRKVLTLPNGMKITEKSVAQAELRRRLLRIQREEAGLIDESIEAATEPIEPLVAAYLDRLRKQGRSDKYICKLEQRINWVIEHGGVQRLGDLTTKVISDALDELAGCGRMPATVNHYRDAVYTFCDWLDRAQGKLAVNPARAVAKEEIKGRHKKQRRAMTPDEIARLLAYAPQYRARFYETAIVTLLRVDELRALRWADLFLDAEEPYIALQAEHTKPRRADRIPLDEEFAGRMRSWKPINATENDRVFPRIPKLDTFKADCDGAKIQWKPDAHGLSLDLHALRKTGNTLMMTSGVSPEVRKQVARVTDKRLVEDVYLDRNKIETRDAVRTINEALRSAQPVVPLVVPDRGSERRKRSRSGTRAGQAPSRKTYEIARVGTPGRALSQVENGGGGGNPSPAPLGVTGEPCCECERPLEGGCTAGCTGVCRLLARFPELGSLLAAWADLPASARESILTILAAFAKPTA